MSQLLNAPFTVYIDSDGELLDAGYIYVGTAGLDPKSNPIDLFWDKEETIPAPNPFRTLNGFASKNGKISNIYLSGTYSIRVENKKNVLVYSSLNNGSINNIMNIIDEGADPSGVNDSSLIFIAANTKLSTDGGVIQIPPGNYKISQNIDFSDNVGVNMDIGAIFTTSGDPVSISFYDYNFTNSKHFETSVNCTFYKSKTVNFNWWGVNGDGATLNDDAFNCVITALGSTGTGILESGAYKLLDDITIPLGTKLIMNEGAYLTSSVAVNVYLYGQFEKGLDKAFSGSITAIFGNGSVKSVTPYWWGAVGDGNDDYIALNAALRAAHSLNSISSDQYNGVRVDLNGGQFGYSSRLAIGSPVVGRGAVLIALGDTPTQFRQANNVFPTSQSGGVAILDCTIIIVDGGSIDGVTFTASSDLDVIGNAGIYLVGMQAIYGKVPLTNCRMNGYSGGKYLNGAFARYCTTSTFVGFGGAYFTRGFFTENCNICSYESLFYEQMYYGDFGFYFNSVGTCRVNGLWVEGMQTGTTPFYFQSCANITVDNLKVGETYGFASQNGTATSADDLITCNTTYLVNGDMLRFSTVGSSGLSLTTTYFVINKTGTTIQVSTTVGGSAFNITGNDTVTMVKAPQSAVTIQSCSTMDFKHLSTEPNALWRYGKTYVKSAGTDILMDTTFEYVQDGYYSATESNTYNYELVTVRNVVLTATTTYYNIGYVEQGTLLDIQLISQSGAITTPAIKTFKLTNGPTYTNKHTITFSSTTQHGEIQSGTRVSFDERCALYIAPSAGTGTVDLLLRYSIPRITSNTLVI